MNKRLDCPVLITGIPRSGASMIAGVFEICGAFFGSIDRPGKNSPRSLFENKSIFKYVEQYLKSVNYDPAGQYPLPNTKELPIPAEWGSKIKNIIQQEGYDDKNIWVYKSNKTALMWPVWNYAFPNARWIIVRRRSGDIIDSCLTTGYMKAFKNPDSWKKVGASNERDAWLWMIHQYEQFFVEMISSGLNCKVIWPERMVNGDYSQMYETLEWVGLKWNTKVLNRILAYIDPKFWKVRRN